MTTETQEPEYKYINTFKPLAWQVEPWKDMSSVMLLTGSSGGGKLLRLSTPIPTPLGWTTMGELSIGDSVLGADGTPARVIAVSDVKLPKKSYEIKFDDGSVIIAGSEHQWLSYTASVRSSLDNKSANRRPVTLTTQEMKDTLYYKTGDGQVKNHAIPVTAPLQLPEKQLPIPGYCLGMQLGDCTGDDTIHSDNASLLVDECERYGRQAKRIPTIYLRSAFHQRVELLQGIVDAGGLVDKQGQVSIIMPGLDLMQDVRELVLSLGIKASVIETDAELNSEVRYRTEFTTNLPVARLPRKRNRLGLGKELGQTQKFRYIVDIQEIDDEPMKCIQVDNNDSLYLCGESFIPTHNSRCAGEKIHGFMLRYPNSTGLILRKVRAVMSNSTLLFMQRKVIGKDPRVRHLPSSFRFEYDNGSVLAYGGMKDEAQREYIRSIGQDGGVDICWIEEATQFTEEDFNEVLARMRGRAAPWTQIILSTNPDAPGHWINVRLILGGEAAIYRSSAENNMYNPRNYIENTLAKLSGVQYRRLVLGEWAAGSGKVIDTWVDDYNPSTSKANDGNVTLDAEYIPDGGIVIWTIDDGYSGKMDAKSGMFTGHSHPRAFLFCQIRQDGTIAVFGESLAVELLASDHIRRAIELSSKNGWPIPYHVIRDRAAASLDGALSDAGFSARYSQMTVDESIKEMREWIAPDLNGVRRVIAHPRCFYLRYQMQTYSLNDRGRIIKAHDDTVDSLRYLIWDQAYGFNPNVDIATIADVTPMSMLA